MLKSPVPQETATINPFTPNNRNNPELNSRKFSKSAKTIRTPNREQISRYRNDFLEICKIGNGEFGDVFKVQHKIDGCIYAVKKTKNPIRGSRAE
jgi:wee1-like protein kinase